MESTPAMLETLLDLLKSHASDEGRKWLEKALQATQPPIHLNTLLGYYSGASRRMGKQTLPVTLGENAADGKALEGIHLNEWGADEITRAVLLLSLHHLPPGEFVEVALQCYEMGDSREQESWMRGLPLLADNGRFLDTAIDACRTNIIPLFEAIACENPYPAANFPEGNFNQLVMKALFNALAIERIVALDSRLNSELSRMTNDFVSEREAAGRDVPSDIWRVLAPCIPAGELERVHRYLNHGDSRHRYWAAVGLGKAGNPVSQPALQARLAEESDPGVKTAIEKALASLASPS